jgi:hypothetical protein
MKKLMLSVLLLAGLQLVTNAQELGLGERRALKAYQDKKYPEILKGIQAAAGFAVPLDVKWEQIAKVGDAEKYELDIYWGTTIFQPLEKALALIAADDAGKTALKSKLKSIVIMHDEKTAPASNYTNGLKFEKGVLTINFTPYTNTDENAMKERIEAIQKFVESKL